MMAGAPEYPPWFARLLEGMRAGTTDGLALGLIANAQALTGDLGPGGTAVGIGVPATLLRMWRMKGLDVLAHDVADRLGLTLTIGDATATGSARWRMASPGDSKTTSAMEGMNLSIVPHVQ